MALLDGGVEKVVGDTFETIEAVVIGSRISRGDTAMDDMTAELLFGVE